MHLTRTLLSLVVVSVGSLSHPALCQPPRGRNALEGNRFQQGDPVVFSPIAIIREQTYIIPTQGEKAVFLTSDCNEAIVLGKDRDKEAPGDGFYVVMLRDRSRPTEYKAILKEHRIKVDVNELVGESAVETDHLFDVKGKRDTGELEVTPESVGLLLDRKKLGGNIIQSEDVADDATIVRFHETRLSIVAPGLGDRVIRGPDWAELWGDADGGEGGIGVVGRLRDDHGWIVVKWERTGREGSYRWGIDGKYDLLSTEKRGTPGGQAPPLRPVAIQDPNGN